MNSNFFHIIGTLRSASYELRGEKNYPVLTVEIQTGEKFYQTEITGQEAEPFQAITNSMPIGTQVRAGVTLTGRRGRDGGVFTGLKLVSLAPDFSGRGGTIGTLTGVIAGIEEKEGKTSTFKVPKLTVLLADRNGLITDHSVELKFSRDAEKEYLPMFESQVGQYAEVEIELDAFITNKGNSITKFGVKKITAVPLPDYLGEIFGVAALADGEDDLLAAV